MSYIIVFFISMVPLIELRGAIPYAIAQGLPYVPSYIIAILGNMLPVPFIYLFARKVLLWGADKPVIGKFFTYCIEKGEKGGKKLQATGGKGLFVDRCCIISDTSGSKVGNQFLVIKLV